MATDEAGGRASAERSPPRIGAHGLGLAVPVGWEVRIRKAAAGTQAETPRPVLHASTDPLPTDRADYGGGVVEKLGSESVFVSLIEFGEEAIGSNLFPVVEQIPRVAATDFHPFQLQRRISGQAGKQIFFTYANRAFCLYVVVGSLARRSGLALVANQLIEQLEISPDP